MTRASKSSRQKFLMVLVCTLPGNWPFKVIDRTPCIAIHTTRPAKQLELARRTHAGERFVVCRADNACIRSLNTCFVVSNPNEKLEAEKKQTGSSHAILVSHQRRQDAMFPFFCSRGPSRRGDVGTNSVFLSSYLSRRKVGEMGARPPESLSIGQTAYLRVARGCVLVAMQVEV